MEFDRVFEAFLKERKPQEYVNCCIEHPEFLEKLIDIIYNLEPYPKSAYASWLVTHVAKKHPKVVQKVYQKLVQCLVHQKDESTLRNLCASLLELNLEEENKGVLMDVLFQFLMEKSHKVALHVNAIYLLVKCAEDYPEIKPELHEVVSLLMENPTPALKVAARKLGY